LEPINNRIHHHLGFEQHFIRGIAKMTTRVGLAIALMTAMAIGHIRQDRPAQMRSLAHQTPPTGWSQPLAPARIGRDAPPEADS
jgi:hypothetical protein